MGRDRLLAASIIALTLPFTLICCSDNPSYTPDGTDSVDVIKPGAAPDERPADAVDKTILQQMADMGFEPARKTARVDFDLTAIDNTPRTLDDYAGNYVLLNFWATWCAPCRIEMPALERLHRKMMHYGLKVVGVDVGEPTADVKRFIVETGITFEVVLDQDLSTSRTYAARSLPMTYILDPEGTIIARAIGVRDWDSEPMQKMFSALVATSTSSAPDVLSRDDSLIQTPVP